MKTVERTQPFLYEVFTRELDPSVPEGTVRVRMVTFETIDLAEGEVDLETQFEVLDWNRPEMRPFQKPHVNEIRVEVDKAEGGFAMKMQNGSQVTRRMVIAVANELLKRARE